MKKDNNIKRNNKRKIHKEINLFLKNVLYL